ncbi:MAG: hypothetical protein ACJA1R_001830 [Flavobacteriales bacterium]|jgi:hypothetical protein
MSTPGDDTPMSDDANDDVNEGDAIESVEVGTYDLDLDDLPKAPSKIPLLIGAAVALFAIAAAPAMLGFGWFGARLLTSDEIDVYVLNTSGQDLDVALPFASVARVPGGTLQTLQTLTGEITIEALSTSGESLEMLEVNATGPVFYNALGSECLVVFDVTDFYGGEANLTIVRRVSQEERIIVLDADTVVLPRRALPSQAIGTVHWVDVVGCALMDPEYEEDLLQRSLFRIQQRREAQQQAREAAGSAP